MKLIIDIPEEKYKTIQEGMYCGMLDADLYRDIKNGIPHETVTEFADRCRECGSKYGKLLKQEPKTGHWIDDTSLGYHVSICSNCDWRGHGDTCLIYKPKYCPNCGCRMVEEQESDHT